MLPVKFSNPNLEGRHEGADTPPPPPDESDLKEQGIDSGDCDLLACRPCPRLPGQVLRKEITE